MTAINDDREQKFDFTADAYLIRKVQEDHLATTGQRDSGMRVGSSGSTSKPGMGEYGKIYKFKNIHGDRGTFAGLSSQAQNQPPSSMWKEHPIPKHLMEPAGI